MTDIPIIDQLRLWREWCDSVLACAEAHDVGSKEDLRGHHFTPEQARAIKRALERHIYMGQAMTAEKMRKSIAEFEALWLPAEPSTVTPGLRLVVNNERKD